MDMRVYIVNAVRYNAGETIGAWFAPPIDIEELKERLFLVNENDYVIHHYDLPFCIDEHIEIEELNRLCTLAKKLEGTPVEHEINVVQQAFFSSFEEMVENINDIKCYPNCENMTDVARYLIRETRSLGEVPFELFEYINYEAYGRDLEAGNGDFLVTSHGVFEYTGN